MKRTSRSGTDSFGIKCLVAGFITVPAFYLGSYILPQWFGPRLAETAAQQMIARNNGAIHYALDSDGKRKKPTFIEPDVHLEGKLTPQSSQGCYRITERVPNLTYTSVHVLYYENRFSFTEVPMPLRFQYSKLDNCFGDDNYFKEAVNSGLRMDVKFSVTGHPSDVMMARVYLEKLALVPR